MSDFTADKLYKKLLEIKHKDPNHQFDVTDLIDLGNPKTQFDQLVYEGRVELKNDIIDSFDVIE